jgi:CRAL/TRIO domain
VYVNYGSLQQLQASGAITTDDVVAAFVIFTERMLSKAIDPRHPQTCQFIDLSGVSISSGFRVDALKQIYNTFEPNYPETLYKMVIYPVSTLMVRFQVINAASPYLSLTEMYLTHLFMTLSGNNSLYQSTTARTLLSFVNEKTKKKFLITNQLDAVCTELGWDRAEVEECGGVTEFMHKHETASDTLLLSAEE